MYRYLKTIPAQVVLPLTCVLDPSGLNSANVLAVFVMMHCILLIAKPANITSGFGSASPRPNDVSPASTK